MGEGGAVLRLRFGLQKALECVVAGVRACVCFLSLSLFTPLPPPPFSLLQFVFAPFRKPL